MTQIDETERTAFRMYLHQAEAGDPTSMFEVAECYTIGLGVSADSRSAVAWYRRAADAQNIDAMLELARCYCVGEGVPRDLAQAMHWLRIVYSTDRFEKLSLTLSRNIDEKALRQLLLLD